MINLTIVFAALAIISLMVMTVFIVAGIIMLIKNKPCKKLFITGMILGVIPVKSATVLLFLPR